MNNLTEEEALRIEAALKPFLEAKDMPMPDSHFDTPAVEPRNLLKSKDLNIDSVISAVAYADPELVNDDRLREALIARINSERVPEVEENHMHM